jgi:hypothetical protein
VADGGIGEERKSNGGNLWPMIDAQKKAQDKKKVEEKRTEAVV